MEYIDNQIVGARHASPVKYAMRIVEHIDKSVRRGEARLARYYMLCVLYLGNAKVYFSNTIAAIIGGKKLLCNPNF